MPSPAAPWESAERALGQVLQAPALLSHLTRLLVATATLNDSGSFHGSRYTYASYNSKGCQPCVSRCGPGQPRQNKRPRHPVAVGMEGSSMSTHPGHFHRVCPHSKGVRIALSTMTWYACIMKTCEAHVRGSLGGPRDAITARSASDCHLQQRGVATGSSG